jgi:hypothetical protein
MTSIKDKRALIGESEKNFAYNLAATVLDKPKISVWMILVPIIIVFYMYKHKKYVSDRDVFAENYLIERNRALEATVSALESDKHLHAATAIKSPRIPENTRKEYTAWMQVLMDHYTALLRCDGETIESLLKSAYQNRTNYLLFLNQLNTVEKQFNAALMPHLQEANENVVEIIQRMELDSEKLRREEMTRVFS